MPGGAGAALSVMKDQIGCPYLKGIGTRMKIIQSQVSQMAIFAYIVGCEKTGRAVIIDPAGSEDALVKKAAEHGFTITKIINTHGHADHTSGNHRMKELTGAPIVVHPADAKSMVNDHSADFTRMLGRELTPPPDEFMNDGDVITAGEEVKLEVISTPGHTPGCVCLYTPGHVFTGDTLFVGAVGRTDLPGGSWPTMLKSIQERLLTLPDETVVWPGHNYGASPSSTIKQERETNPYLR